MRRRVLTAACAVMVVAAARAEPVRLVGRTGFLGEWAIAASLDPAAGQAPGGLLKGPLTLKHTGMCSPGGGAEEKNGEMTLTPGRGGRVAVRLRAGDQDCSFDGALPTGPGSAMRCTDGSVYPLDLKRAP
ncbi:hypothetical protein Mnod_4902 [Methylobacterium nodulans ORS 2060]|uniref:Uncharacterized protein n=1 Tax=Methylobacterium nodulans (strain LMG 21967 / CNCM I-2342 / ORS 2060) TaxID=460265 RepID=B8IH67_METNO|nr:hypothetical protein Mnod_4902 [Methylobacterium nodulans ORS 2060]